MTTCLYNATFQTFRVVPSCNLTIVVAWDSTDANPTELNPNTEAGQFTPSRSRSLLPLPSPTRRVYVDNCYHARTVAVELR